MEIDKRINLTDEEFIKCDCGTHILHVQSSVDLMWDEGIGANRYTQDINLAMFKFGSGGDKEKWWKRIIIGFKYMWTGRMFADQLVLCPEEATKLKVFLEEKIIKS